MSPLGESNVADNFSKCLHQEFIATFGSKAEYVSASLAGNLDRTFADCYIGTGYTHIIIEFKNTIREIPTESRKIARHALVNKISPPLISTANKCHSIAWGNDYPGEDDILFSRYFPIIEDIVNNVLSENSLNPITEKFDYIEQFMNGSIGANIEKFVDYITFLYNISKPNASQREEDIPFFANLYSTNQKGRLIATPINNLKELKLTIGGLNYVINPPSPKLPTPSIKPKLPNFPGRGRGR